MRVPKWVSAVTVTVILIGVAVPFLVSAWVMHRKNAYSQMVHEGRLVADAISAHDRSINIACYTDDHGHADVVIRDVFDMSRQDEIIAWAKGAKAERHIKRVIVITFQKKAVGSEEILREVEI